MFRWPGSRDFHGSLSPPGPVPQSDPILDSPGITTATRAKSRGSVGLARVEAIAGPGQSAGSGGAGHWHWVQAEAGAAFIVSGHGGPRGGAVGATFPETSRLPLRNEDFGISGWRLLWPRGVVLPRCPLGSRNFQTEVMTCGGRWNGMERSTGEGERE